MSSKDGVTKQDDGSYILKRKSKKTKDGDCIECGENPQSRNLLFQCKTEDFKLVCEYMEESLNTHNFKSIKPIWCDKCKALLRYIVNSNDKKSN